MLIGVTTVFQETEVLVLLLLAVVVILLVMVCLVYGELKAIRWSMAAEAHLPRDAHYASSQVASSSSTEANGAQVRETGSTPSKEPIDDWDWVPPAR
jgi:hypothetical protein